MKTFKVILSIALAAILTVSCTDERKTAQYDGKAQGDKIETALCQALLLLNPNFYYDSAEAIAWLINYCAHEHVADTTGMGKDIKELLSKFAPAGEEPIRQVVTVGETLSEVKVPDEKIVTKIYDLSEFTGHFTCVDNPATHTTKWSFEPANNLQVTWPCEDGLVANLCIEITNSNSKILVDEIGDGYARSSEATTTYLSYLALPRTIGVSLTKGGRTLASGSVIASYKIQNEDQISEGDRLNFGLLFTMEGGYKIAVSNCRVNTDFARVGARISKNSDKILRASANITGLTQYEKDTLIGFGDLNANIKLDLMGEVQVAGNVDINKIIECAEQSRDAESREALDKLIIEFNKAIDILVYYDGFKKNPQARFLYVFDEYDGLRLACQTMLGDYVEMDEERLGYCVDLFFYTLDSIGEYFCSACYEEYEPF